MKISGDCPNLDPQPLPSIEKCKRLDVKEELAINKSKLAEMKKQMKFMKEQIKQFIEILQKEVGEEIDVKELLRQGFSTGWQGRAQMIMNLRLRLTAMRSKFLDPPHKMYYRGPFDPKKEFDLKCLPQKQENLYGRMLEEKKQKILQHQKPVDVLKKELDDLCLMYRATRFRTKSLISKINSANKTLDRANEKAEFDLRVVEAMMAHQSLFKMMVDPERFHLDPALKTQIKINPLEPSPISEWTQFKILLDKTEKEKQLYRDITLSLTEKLDIVSKNLIETEKINIENRLSLDAQTAVGSEKATPGKDKKQKGKDKGTEPTEEENDLMVLTQENLRLREFLLDSVLLAAKDFKLFLNAIDVAKNEFLYALQNMKNGDRSEETESG